MNIQTLDVVGSISNFASNILYVRANIFAWPASVIAFICDIFLYFKKGLYADTALNIIYLILTIYGCYIWMCGGKNKTELPITRLPRSYIFPLILITILGTFSCYLLLACFTNSKIPFWDAFTAVLSLIGEWLLCKKIIENWYIWFVLNGMYAGIYFYKAIPFHAVLQIIFFGFAIAGFLFWNKKLSGQQSAASALFTSNDPTNDEMAI
jgi:nicotinamide mononucleotide transporter